VVGRVLWVLLQTSCRQPTMRPWAIELGRQLDNHGGAKRLPAMFLLAHP
jgi:hypothetical protein